MTPKKHATPGRPRTVGQPDNLAEQVLTKKDWKIPQLAKELVTSSRTINRWLSGQTIPDIKKEKLLELLKD